MVNYSKRPVVVGEGEDMNETCSSCRVVSTEQGLSSRPQRLWSDCWCQLNADSEDSALHDIQEFADLLESKHGVSIAASGMDFDVLSRLTGEWAGPAAVPAVVTETPLLPRVGVGTSTTIVLCVVAAIVLLSGVQFSRSAREAQAAIIVSADHVEAVEKAAQWNDLLRITDGGVRGMGRDATLRGIVDIPVDEVEIVPFAPAAPIPPQRVPLVRGARSRNTTAASGRWALGDIATLDQDLPSSAIPPELLGLAPPSVRLQPSDDVAVGASVLQTTEADDPDILRTLSRFQITEALRAVNITVRNCVASGSTDRVLVDVVISGKTGRVASANVRGPLAHSPDGRCVSRAVSQARFPRFLDESLNVPSFPFSLR